MIVSLDTDGLPLAGSPGSVVSIGVFDGVHLGHQTVLRRNVERAAELGLWPTVVTFRAHPKELLLGRAPGTLTSLEHRLDLFRRAGLRHCLALRFDVELRTMEPERFVRELLEERLLARAFVLGFDSKFGRDRRGGPELLRALGHDVEVAPEVVVDKRAVSSTAIREAVELGDMEGARRMLGRPIAVFGEVVEGARLGRSLGFPTANLDLHHELHPPPGVYASRVRIVGEDELPRHPAVTNIGYRPTVAGERPEAPVVEVHLLDLERDLYGRRLEVEFVERLREERRFPDLEALRRQIGRDVERARGALAAPRGGRRASGAESST